MRRALAPFSKLESSNHTQSSADFITNTSGFSFRYTQSVELDEKPTVGVRQPGPTLHLAPQYDQLLPERCILRLKSALRLEWRSQDAQHKEDQRYHAARIADSLTPPTRMRFSAHTTGGRRLRHYPRRRNPRFDFRGLEDFDVSTDRAARRPPEPRRASRTSTRRSSV